MLYHILLIRINNIWQLELTVYDKAYFTSVHFLVHYTSVNIPLMPRYGIHDIQR